MCAAEDCVTKAVDDVKVCSNKPGFILVDQARPAEQQEVQAALLASAQLGAMGVAKLCGSPGGLASMGRCDLW